MAALEGCDVLADGSRLELSYVDEGPYSDYDGTTITISITAPSARTVRFNMLSSVDNSSSPTTTLVVLGKHVDDEPVKAWETVASTVDVPAGIMNGSSSGNASCALTNSSTFDAAPTVANYSTVLGSAAIPNALTDSPGFDGFANAIKQARLARCPIERGVTYYIEYSASGNSTGGSGAGTEADPWLCRSVSDVNTLMNAKDNDGANTKYTEGNVRFRLKGTFWRAPSSSGEPTGINLARKHITIDSWDTTPAVLSGFDEPYPNTGWTNPSGTVWERDEATAVYWALDSKNQNWSGWLDCFEGHTGSLARADAFDNIGTNQWHWDGEPRITSVTSGATTTIEFEEKHNLSVSDSITIEGTSGMTPTINGARTVATVVNATSITIAVNTTGGTVSQTNAFSTKPSPKLRVNIGDMTAPSTISPCKVASQKGVECGAADAFLRMDNIAVFGWGDLKTPSTNGAWCFMMDEASEAVLTECYMGFCGWHAAGMLVSSGAGYLMIQGGRYGAMLHDPDGSIGWTIVGFATAGGHELLISGVRFSNATLNHPRHPTGSLYERCAGMHTAGGGATIGLGIFDTCRMEVDPDRDGTNTIGHANGWTFNNHPVPTDRNDATEYRGFAFGWVYGQPEHVSGPHAELAAGISFDNQGIMVAASGASNLNNLAESYGIHFNNWWTFDGESERTAGGSTWGVYISTVAADPKLTYINNTFSIKTRTGVASEQFRFNRHSTIGSQDMSEFVLMYNNIWQRITGDADCVTGLEDAAPDADKGQAGALRFPSSQWSDAQATAALDASLAVGERLKRGEGGYDAGSTLSASLKPSTDITGRRRETKTAGAYEGIVASGRRRRSNRTNRSPRIMEP